MINSNHFHDNEHYPVRNSAPIINNNMIEGFAEVLFTHGSLIRR